MRQRVKQLCKERDLKFKELAQKVGITEIGLRQSLDGNPTVGTLRKVADALGVEVVDLFGPPFLAVVVDQEGTHTFTNKEEFLKFAESMKTIA